MTQNIDSKSRILTRNILVPMLGVQTTYNVEQHELTITYGVICKSIKSNATNFFFFLCIIFTFYLRLSMLMV